ncbi:MAG: tetratricopeptide repeat protein [Gemmatimonadetes bacterium]|nr:tetratricopeptide repeat protein [Gemmatimonadota bacterium]MYG17049.1 tetratricopeptide repeat protein [Gemmatimonadota bacterium]
MLDMRPVTADFRSIMNRDSLVKEVASDLQVSRHKVRVVLNGFLSEVTEAMHRDERVNLHRFGAFNVKVRKARTARDLNTNVELRLNDRHIPHFMPFDTLKDTVAQQSPVSEEQTGPVAVAPVRQQVEETPRERSDDVTAMMNRAEVLANKGKIEQAIQQYRRVLERQPGHATATGGLGRMFFRLGAQETALEHYNRALGNDPGHLDTLVDRAELFVEMGQYEDARTDLLRVLEYDPYSYPACYMLGVLYITIGTYDAAIRVLSRALDVDRTKAEVHLQLGKAYCHVEKHTEAIEHFEALLRHDPRNEQAYRYLGTIYDKIKQADKALEMYRKSNEIGLV